MSVHPVFLTLLSVLWSSFLTFLSLTGGLVVFGLILGYLERQSNSHMIRSFGLKGVYVTAWLGTPIHELSHAALCLLFGHRVTGIKLFQRSDVHGTIGYVSHAYNPDSLYQRIGNLFIGTAPLFGGSLAILLFGRILLPDTFQRMSVLIFSSDKGFQWTDLQSWTLYGHRLTGVFSILFSSVRLWDDHFWIFAILALCTASHMSLSMEDIRGAASGAGALALLIVVANSVSAVLDPSLGGEMMMLISRLNASLLLTMGLAVFFSMIQFLISWGLDHLRYMTGK
jgi:hypothetical protein